MAKYTLPPRQKMINLIYVILLAMLAINVSDDVMKGYSTLNKSYITQNDTWRTANNILLKRIAESGNDSLYAKAQKADSMSRSLENYINRIKEDIARQADKKNYEPGKLTKEEDLKAVPYIMLAPTQNNGRKLRKRLEELRLAIVSNMKEKANRDIVASYLSTTPPKNRIGTSFSWERENFSSLPAIGGILLLNRIKENILLSENEGLRDLLLQSAGVVNQSGTVGFTKSDYEDSENDGGLMSAPLETGEINDLYSGTGNPVNLYPGIPSRQLRMTTDNGSMKIERGTWVIYPRNPGRNANVTVRRQNGSMLGRFSFNVKPLPDPSPYLMLGSTRYSGGVPVSKRRLTGNVRLGASYRDGNVNISFRIVSFETVFIHANGGIDRMHSSGGQFSSAQKDRLRNLAAGDKFYVTSIMVEDRNGRQREIESLNVIVN